MRKKIKINSGSEAAKIISMVAGFSRKYGLEAYLVGGFVRDLLMDRRSRDLDFTFDKDPQRAASLTALKLKAAFHSHPAFHTYSLRTAKSSKIDFAVLRAEEYPEPAVLPVVFKGSFAEDMYRRDFSINAISARVNSAGGYFEISDPFGGLQDIKDKILRVMHSGSFTDDPTRIFRLARFMARFKFEPDIMTVLSLKKALSARVVGKLTPVRLRNELEAIFGEARPESVFSLLNKWGVAEQINSYDGKFQECEFPGKNKYGRLNFAILLKNWRYEKIQSFLRRLELPGGEINTIISSLKALRCKCPANGAICDVDNGFLKYLGVDERRRLSLGDSARKKSPVVRGRDLAGWGYKPGKEFKKMLLFARRAFDSGRVKTRRQAQKLIFDNFRR